MTWPNAWRGCKEWVPGMAGVTLFALGGDRVLPAEWVGGQQAISDEAVNDWGPVELGA